MTVLDTETKKKLRDMGAAALLDALTDMDEALTLGMSFEEKIKLAVDDAHTVFTNAKIHGLKRRSGVRYPDADLRRVDLITERGLDHATLAQLATCRFVDVHHNLVFQGFTGSGKSYLGSAVANEACHHRIRAHYLRMPDLEELISVAVDKPHGKTQLLKKLANFTLLVLDEWLLDPPDEAMQSFLLELLERRYDAASTVFCTQYPKKDWHSRLGGAVHADAIMDRVVHNTTWIETGTFNMRERQARTTV